MVVKQDKVLFDGKEKLIQGYVKTAKEVYVNIYALEPLWTGFDNSKIFHREVKNGSFK